MERDVLSGMDGTSLSGMRANSIEAVMATFNEGGATRLFATITPAGTSRLPRAVSGRIYVKFPEPVEPAAGRVVICGQGLCGYRRQDKRMSKETVNGLFPERKFRIIFPGFSEIERMEIQF